MSTDARRILAVILLAAFVSGGTAVPGRRALGAGPPALELKNIVSFPLSGQGLPASRQGLIDAISDGLRGRVQLPSNARPVLADGADYPALKSLKVDLTHASIDSGHQLPKLKPRGPVEETVQAEQFQFVADPMNVDGAHISLDVRARDVQLGLQRDRGRTPILILTDARNGTVRCDTTLTDLSRIFRASADFRGKPYGLSVQRAKLNLAGSDDEHQLRADLRMASRLLLMPISLHFTAQVDVDDEGNAHLSNLRCNGDDIAGWLISGIIRPSLAQQDNRSMPLIAFPTERVKLREVRVKIDDDHVHLEAAFGSQN